jgi:hypothetical protein
MAHFIFKKLSFILVRLGFSVHNLLGPGLLESAYEGAFCLELSLAGLFLLPFMSIIIVIP